MATNSNGSPLLNALHSKKKSRTLFQTHMSEEQRLFVEKMLDVGWEVNHDFLNNMEGAGPDDEIDFRRLMFGFKVENDDGDCHMMSPNKDFTVRVTKKTANFWKFPEFDLVAMIGIQNAEIVGNAIRQGIVEVNLDFVK